MIPSIKAEFRKLLTVRSTYILVAVCLAFTILIAFYAMGFRASPDTAAHDTHALTGAVTAAVGITSLFVALAGVLLVTHEYRYNTIMYTLTAARRRWYMLASKTVVASTFAVVVAVVITLLAPQLMRLGLHAHHITLIPQDVSYGSLLLRCIFYIWGYTMFGLIISFIVRSQVGSIVILLVFPALVENLLSLLLKAKSIYLPFSALNPLLTEDPSRLPPPQLTVSHAVLVVLAYVVGGWLVAMFLLHKRDAN